MIDKLKYALCLLTIVLAATACSSDDGEENVVPTATTHIKFTLTMSGADVPATKAGAWGDEDYDTEAANTWESTIGVGKLQVFAYDTSDKYIGQVESLVFVRRSANQNIYDVYGELSVEASTTSSSTLNCRLVVLANYDNAVSQASAATLESLSTTLYAYNAAGIRAATSYIPMWGVQTYSGSTALQLEEGETVDAGEIFLLRAMSKIRVALSDDVADDFVLQGVSITDYNSVGYIVPADYDVSDTKTLYYSGTTSPLSFHPRAMATGRSLDFQTETASKSYIVYVPEYATKTDAKTGGTNPYLSVTIAPKGNTADAGVYRINLRQYIDGTPQADNLDLIRNTVYDYRITAVGPTLSLRYQAIDWTTGGGNISFE